MNGKYSSKKFEENSKNSIFLEKLEKGGEIFRLIIESSSSTLFCSKINEKLSNLLDNCLIALPVSSLYPVLFNQGDRFLERPFTKFPEYDRLCWFLGIGGIRRKLDRVTWAKGNNLEGIADLSLSLFVSVSLQTRFV